MVIQVSHNIEPLYVINICIMMDGCLMTGIKMQATEIVARSTDEYIATTTATPASHSTKWALLEIPLNSALCAFCYFCQIEVNLLAIPYGAAYFNKLQKDNKREFYSAIQTQVTHKQD